MRDVIYSLKITGDYLTALQAFSSGTRVPDQPALAIPHRAIRTRPEALPNTRSPPETLTQAAASSPPLVLGPQPATLVHCHTHRAQESIFCTHLHFLHQSKTSRGIFSIMENFEGVGKQREKSTAPRRALRL